MFAGQSLAAAMIFLATGKSFNYSHMIFENMEGNSRGARKVAKFLMYPRFIKMIINSRVLKLTPIGKRLQLRVMDVSTRKVMEADKSVKFTELFDGMLLKGGHL
jgi:hypothetical protein